MIHLLYGEDELTISETLSAIRKSAEPDDVGDLNTTVFEGREVGFAELSAACDTVPFLAEKRLVIVRGLLTSFEPRSPSQSRSQGSTSKLSSSRLGEWNALADYLTRVPETTDLVFVEGRLSGSNPLLAAIRPNVTTRVFAAPGHGELRQWIRKRASADGVDIEPGAVDALADTIGGDLRAVANELQKLSLYRSGDTIKPKDVHALVSYSREANVFAAVDAVVERRPAPAMKQMHSLLESGKPVSYILTMLARQVRLLILAKELKGKRVATAELGKRLGLAGYPLRKTLDQEPRLSYEQLVGMHRKLLEADLSIKSQGVPEDLVLDTLIADLCAAQSYRDVGLSAATSRRNA